MLTCSGIHLNYGDESILRDVSVSIEPGCVTALIGPSGAGKSTLLRTLAFLEQPNTGELALDNHSFSFPSSEEVEMPSVWPMVTAVFQELFLWPHLSLRENIALPLRIGRIEGAEQRIENLVKRFEMSDFIDRYPNQVSGGQRQRAALARALALKPAYLLLDEITSALDVQQAAAIVVHLDDLKREEIGILVITHYLGFVYRSADRIIFMNKGRVEETGGREILDSPRSPGLQRYLRAFEQMEDRFFTNGATQ